VEVSAKKQNNASFAIAIKKTTPERNYANFAVVYKKQPEQELSVLFCVARARA